MSEIMERLHGLMKYSDLKRITELVDIIFQQKMPNAELYLIDALNVYPSDKLLALCRDVYKLEFAPVSISELSKEIMDNYKDSCFVPVGVDDDKRRLVLVCTPENRAVRPTPFKNFQVDVKLQPLHIYIRLYKRKYGDPPFLRALPEEDIFRLIVAEAVQMHASDMTIAERPDNVQVYYNINKRQVQSKRSTLIAKHQMRSLITYLQMAASVNTSLDKRAVVYGGVPLDADFNGRMVINYSLQGYLTTIRLLSRKIARTTRRELNILDEVIDFTDQHLMNLRSGLKIFSGPTMSGKNTFIIAQLFELYQKYKCKIVSVEMPVEIITDFVEQIEVLTDEELTESVESLLRQNPDVVYIAELKDAVIATAALELANTAKATFTTVHANGPAEVPSRLMDLTGWSVDKILMILDTVVHQELLPRKCPYCNDEYDDDCPRCYEAGMVPVQRYLHIDEEVRKAVIGKSLPEIYTTLESMTQGNDMAERLLEAGVISRKTLLWRGLN